MYLKLTQVSPCPAAILDHSGRVVLANNDWLRMIDAPPGVDLEQALRVDFEKMGSGWWQDIFKQMADLHEAEIDLEIKNQLWRMNLSRDHGQGGNLWLRLDPEPLRKGDFAKITHEARMGEMAAMTAGIAHEITNPLTIVMARAEILKLMFRDDISEHAKKTLDCVSAIASNSQRITKIVRAMRNFSRSANLDPFVAGDLPELLEESIALCSQKARLRGVKFSVAPAPSLAKVNCRPVQVTQIFVNLLNNALDATASLPMAEIAISFRETDEFIDTLICDNGPGVPKDIVKKIFYPFYTTKDFGQGTGLGLSLSLRMSRSNGGDLFLDESVGASCFVLRLKREIGLSKCISNTA